MNRNRPLKLQAAGRRNGFSLQAGTAFVHQIFSIKRTELFRLSRFDPLIIGCLVLTVNLYCFQPVFTGSQPDLDLKNLCQRMFVDIVPVFFKQGSLSADNISIQ